MLTIKTWRDPYDAGFSPTRPKEITFNEGFTVIVGCNGVGKTTLLKNIKSVLKDNVPVYLYDNLHDGGSNAMSEAFYHSDYSLGSFLFSASEGEAIKENFAQVLKLFNRFIDTGEMETRQNRFLRAFRQMDKEAEPRKESNKRVILLDAIDSGMSVDNVIEIKEVFRMLMKYAEEHKKELYIIVSANEYELARGEQCFDVAAGKYIELNNYEDYRSFIIKSRKKKEKRLEKQQLFEEKQKSKTRS